MSALDGFGVQFSELPPRGPVRLREYPTTFVYFLRDPKARVTQFGLEVVSAANPNARITQFGLEVVISIRPAGTQFSGNSPAGKPRLLDYTWLNPGGGSSVVSTVPPVPPAGLLPSTSDNLPPRGPARLRDYTWFNTLLPYELGQDKLPVGQSTFLSDNLPPRAPARARDYTFTYTVLPQLLAQDAMNPGEQSFDLPPKAPARLRDYSLASAFPVSAITAPPPPNPRFDAGSIPGDPTALPPRGPARLRDYTHLSYRLPGLVDAQNPGAQLSDLPPRSAPRLRDYTFTYAFPVQFPPAPPQPPLGVGNPFVGRVLDLPPYGRPQIRGSYPMTQTSLALRASPPVLNEQFQAILFI